MSALDLRRDIYGSLHAAGKPYEPPGMWAKLPASDSFRWAGAEAVNSVAEQYGLPGVIDAGLCRAEHSPVLTGTQELLWFTWRAGEAKPYQVIAGRRGLGLHAGASAAVLQDEQFAKLLESTGSIVLTTRMTDSAILRSMGISVMLGTGWHDLGGNRLQTLYRELCALRQTPSPPKITLLGWSVEHLQHVDDRYLGLVATHLQRINEHLDLDLAWEWWRPSQDRLRSLAFNLEFGFEDCAEEWLRLSLSDDCIADLNETDRPSKAAPTVSQAELRDAVHQLRVTQGRADSVERRQANQRFQQVIANLVTEPMLARSYETTDPLLRARLLGMAAVAPIAISELHLLASRLCAGSVDPRQIGAILSDEEFQRLLKLLDALHPAPKGPASNGRNK